VTLAAHGGGYYRVVWLDVDGGMGMLLFPFLFINVVLTSQVVLRRKNIMHFNQQEWNSGFQVVLHCNHRKTLLGPFLPKSSALCFCISRHLSRHSSQPSFSKPLHHNFVQNCSHLPFAIAACCPN
jgi:hypothetical protein